MTEWLISVYERVNTMADNEKEYRCKYCGAKTKKYHNICVDCYRKLPAVKELVEVCQRIKELVGDNK